eukprot:7388539-Prymnesium_polylepis.1
MCIRDSLISACSGSSQRVRRRPKRASCSARRHRAASLPKALRPPWPAESLPVSPWLALRPLVCSASPLSRRRRQHRAQERGRQRCRAARVPRERWSTSVPPCRSRGPPK